MYLNLNDYQFITSRYSYSYRLTHMNPTNQKPKIDAQKVKRKEHKHNTKKIFKQLGKKLKEEKKNREELQEESENK